MAQRREGMFGRRKQQVTDMVSRVFYHALFAAVFVLAANAAVSAQSVDSTNPVSGRIILIEPKEPKGALKIRQAAHTGTVDAVEGMFVRRGYLLILNATARAIVLCGDGKKRELGPGRQGCPCTRSCTPEVCGLVYDGSTIGATRGTDTAIGNFPVVVSPRKTMLLDLRPAIRWTPVADANEHTVYRITLYGEGMKAFWTRSVVAKTSLTYPEAESALNPGETYKVVVTSNGASSEQDSAPGLGFTTLTADQARTLAADEMKRKQADLPETQTRFVIANLFAARGLYAEAIQQLQHLYTTMKEAPVAGMIGDLYVAVGLSREAERSYLDALNLISPNNFDERALTEQKLAMVYENLGNADQTIARLREAIKSYRVLGNQAMVNSLTVSVRKLMKSKGRS